YWMYRFRDPLRDRPGPPRFEPGNIGEMGYAKERTPLQASFTSSFSITCQVSMLGFLVVTALFSKRLPPHQREFWEHFFLFQEAFFAITIVLAVLLNVSSAVTMISLFELVTKFPLGYFAAVLSGQALCGIFSSLVQILTLSINSRNPTTSAFIFFGVGSLIILLTTVFYLITKRKSKYFIYRIGQYEGTSRDGTQEKWTVNLFKMKTALQRTKWYLGSIVFVKGSSAMIHPGLAALVVSEDKDSGLGNAWNEIYFVPVITFLCFHSSDFIGREVARKVEK
ncbi:hypothetical protein NQ314_008173, partial [Rhamnusium bicolor]